MADSAGVLAQVAPSAGVLTDAYAVPPTKTYAVVSTIVVCNRDPVAALYRIAVAVAGAADNVKQYIAYDEEIPGNSSFTWTLGITPATTDVIRVRTDNATVSFNIFGVEVT